MQEVWKDIENFEGIYQVSNLGRVKSFHNTNNRWKSQKERILKSSSCGNGYKTVILNKNSKRKTIRIHTLVWDAFGDTKRNGRKLQIDHIDNDKLNNNINNLQLLTCRQNIIKGYNRKKRKYPIGVRKTKYNRYQALIWINGKKIHLGNRLTLAAAAELYQQALANLNE